MTTAKRKRKAKAKQQKLRTTTQRSLDPVLQKAYPNLSSLAAAAGASLDDLGSAVPAPSITYLGLPEACFLVRSGVPRSPRPDAYGYLATVEAFLGRGILGVQTKAKRKFWSKLIAPGSSFLDTVAEAAWAVHFADKSIPVRTDVLFDTADPDSKDADVAIKLDGKDWWLDVKSIHPEADVFPFSTGPAPSPDDEDATLEPEGTAFALLNADQIVGILAGRARSKYGEKFGEAVATGPLAKSPVGVLLCIVKWEQCIPIVESIQPAAPSTLFSDCPNLAVVWVHTFAKSPGDDLLRPYVVLRWFASVTGPPPAVSV